MCLINSPTGGLAKGPHAPPGASTAAWPLLAGPAPQTLTVHTLRLARSCMSPRPAGLGLPPLVCGGGETVRGWGAGWAWGGDSGAGGVGLPWPLRPPPGPHHGGPACPPSQPGPSGAGNGWAAAKPPPERPPWDGWARGAAKGWPRSHPQALREKGRAPVGGVQWERFKGIRGSPCQPPGLFMEVTDEAWRVGWEEGG